MTPEQRAAFINAQTCMMQAELAMMAAENTERDRNGYSLAYSGAEFSAFLARWEPVLGYNAVISFFQQ